MMGTGISSLGDGKRRFNLFSYYFGSQKVEFATGMTRSEAVEALETLRGDENIRFERLLAESFVMYSIRHIGRRGAPIIPKLNATIWEDQEGKAVISGTFSIERRAKLMVGFFTALALFLLLLALSDLRPQIMVVAAVFAFGWLALLFAGSLSGRRDIEGMSSALRRVFPESH